MVWAPNHSPVEVVVRAFNHSPAEVVVRAFNHSPAEEGNQPPVPGKTSVTASAMTMSRLYDAG